MSSRDSPDPAQAASSERELLEQAHHDICTALTVLANNVELVRIRLRDEPPGSDTRVAVHAHLNDIEWANERIHQVARDLRSAWQARYDRQD